MFIFKKNNRLNIVFRGPKCKTGAGFTLIEALIATTVLVTSMAGPLVMAQRSLNTAVLAKEQSSASYLAQEAVEYIRNKRDENTLDGNKPWLTGLSDCIGNKCVIDVPNEKISPCAITGCPYLKFDDGTKFYGYKNGWADSKFIREVELVSLSSHEFSIEVKIKWETGIFDREFFIRNNIFDWQ